MVWDLDVSWDTSKIATASGDNSIKVWDAQYGKVRFVVSLFSFGLRKACLQCLHTINTPTPARSISMSYSGNLVAFTTMKMTKNLSALTVFDLRDPNQVRDNEFGLASLKDANNSIF